MLNPRYVDTREQSRIAPLQAAGFVPKALASGDVQFPEYGGGVVLIEHKTVRQLLADMVSGTLMRQCRGVIAACDYPILMPEGHWRQDGNGRLLDQPGFTWEQAWNQLDTIQNLGMRIQLTTSPEHTIRRILELAEKYGKEMSHSVARGLPGDHRVAVLALIDGVAESRSKVILDVLGGSLLSVALAEQETIEQLPGIGPKLARSIYEFWR